MVTPDLKVGRYGGHPTSPARGPGLRVVTSA